MLQGPIFAVCLDPGPLAEHRLAHLTVQVGVVADPALPACVS